MRRVSTPLLGARSSAIPAPIAAPSRSVPNPGSSRSITTNDSPSYPRFLIVTSCPTWWAWFLILQQPSSQLVWLSGLLRRRARLRARHQAFYQLASLQRRDEDGEALCPPR